MKIFVFLTLILSIKNEISLVENSECDPRNIYITLNDDYSNSDTLPSLKIGFNVKKVCQTAMVVKIEHKEEILTYNFDLAGTYVTKIFDQVKAENYIRYTYLSESISFEHDGEFDYTIYSNYDVEPVMLKKFAYKSNITKISNDTAIRILTYGDQPLNDETKRVIEAFLKEEFDLIILLGDFANMINDDYGQKGDEFFDLLEPLMTRAPVLITPGIKDMSDSGNLLNYRFKFAKNYTKYENNYYTINLKNISFFFFQS